MTKKKVLLISVIGLLLTYVFSNPVLFGFCVDVYEFNNYKGCLDEFPELLSILLISLSLSFLPFSLLTYKLREEVFQAWWCFARWFALVIIVITFLLSIQTGGGTLGMNKDFTAFILIILYSVFVAVSLIKIIRAYLKTKVESVVK